MRNPGGRLLDVVLRTLHPIVRDGRGRLLRDELGISWFTTEAEVSDKEFKFLELLIQGVAALGTVAAVVAALWLARRDWSVRLRVRAGVRRIVLAGQPIKEAPEFVTVSVTNLGRRVVEVTSVFFKPPLLGNGDFLMTPPENPWSGSIPTRLEEGETVSLHFPLPGFDEELRKIAGACGPGILGWYRRRYLRIGAFTSVERGAAERVEKGLRDRIEGIAMG